MFLPFFAAAFAYDIEEACPTITVPADALPWDGDRGVLDAMRDITAAADVWTDSSCVWEWRTDDLEEECTTTAGAYWTRWNYDSDPDHTEQWSVVLPAGLDTWTQITYVDHI